MEGYNPKGSVLGINSINWYTAEDTEYPLDFIGKGSPTQRGGSRTVAKEKGFVKDGWTAYFSRTARLWYVWGPTGIRYKSLVLAVTAYNSDSDSAFETSSNPSKKPKIDDSYTSSTSTSISTSSAPPSKSNSNSRTQQLINTQNSLSAATLAGSQDFYSPDEFVWYCTHCTLSNSYKKKKCDMCSNAPDAKTNKSEVLTIATGLVKTVNERRPRNSNGDVIIPGLVKSSATGFDLASLPANVVEMPMNQGNDSGSGGGSGSGSSSSSSSSSSSNSSSFQDANDSSTYTNNNSTVTTVFVEVSERALSAKRCVWPNLHRVQF